jgi:hypothetical protein
VKDVTKLMNSEPCNTGNGVLAHRSPNKPNSFITSPRQLGRYDWPVNMVGLGLPVGIAAGNYCFSTSSRPVLGPTQPAIQ